MPAAEEGGLSPDFSLVETAGLEPSVRAKDGLRRSGTYGDGDLVCRL